MGTRAFGTPPHSDSSITPLIVLTVQCPSPLSWRVATGIVQWPSYQHVCPGSGIFLAHWPVLWRVVALAACVRLLPVSQSVKLPPQGAQTHAVVSG